VDDVVFRQTSAIFLPLFVVESVFFVLRTTLGSQQLPIADSSLNSSLKTTKQPELFGSSPLLGTQYGHTSMRSV
jgi:hypothetical protein